MDLKGGVAVVTGAGTGMGAATAKRFAAKGANVVVNCPIAGDDAKATVAACEAAGVEAILVKGDVTSDADCRAIAAAAVEKWGRIDALVNNAGITKFVAHDDLDGLDGEDFHRIYDVNVVGSYQMVRAVAPAMRQGGQGGIVNIASIAGVDGSGSCVAYAASKGALITMTRSLGRALGPEIRVNAICPGVVETGWVPNALGQGFFDEMKGKMERALPLGRVAQADDIAEAATWLIEGGDLITGETLLVDSGLHLIGNRSVR